jgi:hypothetical protein
LTSGAIISYSSPLAFYVIGGKHMTSHKYEWQNDYRAALIELNQKRLSMRIEKAEATIAARRLALYFPVGHEEEIAALENAFRNLDILKRERAA